MIPYITNDHENMNTLPNPSYPRPRFAAMLRLAGLAAKRGRQGRGTHTPTPLSRGDLPSPLVVYDS